MKNINLYYCKIILTLWLIFSSFLTSYTQKVFNIKADFFYIKNEDLSFINKKNNSLYAEFWITYHFFDNLENNTVNKSIINYIDTVEYPVSYFNKNKQLFISPENKKNKLIKNIDKIQFVGRNFEYDKIIVLKYNKNLFLFRYYDKGKLSEADFFRYFIILINNKYPVFVIIDEEGYAFSYIYQEKKNIKFIYEETNFKNEKKQNYKKNELLFANYKFTGLPGSHLQKFYKVKKIKNKYILVDKLWETNILNKKFDDLSINGDFVLSKKKNKIILYNCCLEKIKEKNIRAVSYSGSNFLRLQIIQNNDIFWLDRFGNKYLKPKIFVETICGNEDMYIKTISKINDTFYYVEKFYDDYNEVLRYDTTKMLLPENTENITFADNSYNAYYNSNRKVENITFIIKNTDNKYSLVKAEKIKNKITVKKTDLINADKIENLNGNLRFFKNGLYGYYPQNKEAKYKKLQKYNYNYARFEYPDGRKGWTDKKGNEYFDK